MKRLRLSTHLLPLILVIIGLSAAPVLCGADEIDVKAINKGKELLNDKRKQDLFASFAHPTAKMTRFDYDKLTTSANGFKLIYKFNFISALNKPFYSKLALEFDVDGNYRAVEGIATSGLIGPFTATSTVLEMVKNRVKDNPALQNKEVMLLIDKVDVKGLLKFMLKSLE